MKQKRIYTFLMVFIVGVFSMSKANAQENVEERLVNLEERVSVLEELTLKSIACNHPAADLRNAPIGFKCITSKGAVFERVARENFGEAWKDPDGLIWSRVMDGIRMYDQNTFAQATETCDGFKSILPSRKDFENGIANGFNEVLSFSKRHNHHWSRGVQKSTGYAYTYLQSGNYISDNPRRNNNASFFCVSGY